MRDRFSIQLEYYKNLAEETLDSVFSAFNIPNELNNAMRYSVFAGGKRLRPSLCYAVWEMLGGDLSKTSPNCPIRILGASIELIHTYSLIHDDLPCMDDDDFRRGKPSNHKMFGEAMAILAGDALLNLAYENLFSLCKNNPFESQNIIKAAELIANCAGATGMVAGQTLDMNSNNSNDKKQLKEIHSLKTGMLIRASVLCGAFLHDISQECFERLDEFAKDFGILFQITDDLLDECGEEANLGKTTGKDKASGKLTYVSVFGVEVAKSKANNTAHSAKERIAGFENSEFLARLVDETLTRIK
ncbi:MAG: polyprenyl synthetase family protein [Clostridiales bacterium]|nr:polyprenyl synthetase family protein [Clostridiales bacterium]